MGEPNRKIQLLCQRCAKETAQGARFCPHCGWDLAKPSVRYRLGGRGVIILLLSTSVLWGTSRLMQSEFAGTKPTLPYVEAETEQSAWDINSDPELVALKAEVNKTDSSLEALRKYGSALLERMRTMQKPPSAILFEAMDVMTSILKVVPDDSIALVSMGDIAFNQQIFDKAVSYYQAYLRKNPEEDPVRARLASALTFLGKGDEALKELRFVLDRKPNDFHALAYTAITYAQMGKKAEALKYGDLALAHAPNDEARERFSSFLSSIKSSAAADTSASKSEDNSIAGKLSTFLKANPVAGQKFVRVEDSSPQEIGLYFRDFPMAAMPEFARNKFIQGIATKIGELGVSKEIPVIIYDATSKVEMARVAH